MVCAGVANPSFVVARRTLADIADWTVSSKQVERVVKGIGRERNTERDEAAAAYLARAERGAGFAEVADAVIAARAKKALASHDEVRAAPLPLGGGGFRKLYNAAMAGEKGRRQ